MIPISTQARFEKFDLGSEVWQAIQRSEESLEEGDIVVISSKYAAISEGRMVKLSEVTVGKQAKSLAAKYDLEPELAQLVLQESDAVLGGIRGFVLSVVSDSIAPNAGIDKSNVPKGWSVQYPENPFQTALNLHEYLLQSAREKENHIHKLGIILSDSRVTPTRLGTVGVAVAYAGMKPTIDMRGTPDLLGNKLIVTLKAVADQLATAAQLVMGESNEGRPIVIIRGYQEAFSEPRSDLEKKTTISPEQCLILSSLRDPFNL